MLWLRKTFIAATILTTTCVGTNLDVAKDSWASSNQNGAEDDEAQKDLSIFQRNLFPRYYIVELDRLTKLEEYGHCGTTPSVQMFDYMESECELQKKLGDDVSSLYKPVNQYPAASWVDSYSTPDSYIASQAPLDDEQARHFWDMVWSQNVRVIAMLTMPVENGRLKSAQYWPNMGQTKQIMGQTKQISETYDITAVDRKEEFGYICTQLHVWNVVEKVGRGISHCIFTEWPDMKIPQNPVNLLKFRDHVKRLAGVPQNPGANTQGVNSPASSSASAPILVHCMAGRGRTGTFIAIDVLIDRMESVEGRPVDLAGVVHRLRLQRPGAILCSAQYYFCITALKSYQSIIDNETARKASQKH